jgi:hypothetical protein
MNSSNQDSMMVANMHATCNRAEIEKSTLCYCYCCCNSFGPDEIKEWINEFKLIGETAICPKCGIDSVLGDSCGMDLTEEFLEELRKYWFGA